MSRIRGKHTKPELLVRSALFGMGYRFRLHKTDLPGRPDIYIPSLQTAVFVNGCFWHLHSRCKQARLPRSNVEFWRNKLTSNCKRDRSNYRSLRKLGKRVIVVWECEIERHGSKLPDYVGAMLNP
jgi:DNA mismatch endonuclease, patch repair protein